MALNIRNAEAERLAERVVALTGETKTTAVTLALRERLERLERLERAPGPPRLADELDAIARHSASLPLLDLRSADEILGYDADGLAR
jgi:antitoxin VapB